MLVSKEALLDQIMKYDFAVQEATLFLDTHPNDKEAFCYYKECNNMLTQAKEMYARNYGALNNRSSYGNCYDYINAPWPWEVNASCGCMKNDCNFQ